MRKVAALGVGQTKVDEHWGKSIKELAGDAAFSALQDADRDQVDSIFVGNMLSGISSHQENLGALIVDWIGFWGVESIKVEAACGSGGAAIRSAIQAIGSGMVDSALVIGVEKMTETHPAEMTSALATAADADWEVVNGVSFVGLNALLMRRYLHEYDWNQEDFAPFAINAHANACTNKYARLQMKITEQDYAKARVVCSPINLLDASPIGDGAAAVYLCAAEILPRGIPKVVFSASSLKTDLLAVHGRKDPLWLKAVETSSKDAYRQAGLHPTNIDVFEYHDAFSIMAVLSLEAAGFSDRGKALTLAHNGGIELSGKIPVATFGGLKARGHPVGATGVYQVVEVVLQLWEQAGENQVPGAKIGMAQNIGGSGSTVATHILQIE